jgi:hypothetical protein
MTLVLKPEMFTNNKYRIAFGNNREAEFTIVDETFESLGNQARINRINVFVYTRTVDDEITDATLGFGIVGIGNGVFGVMSNDIELRGQQLTHENMERCVVDLYEDV